MSSTAFVASSPSATPFPTTPLNTTFPSPPSFAPRKRPSLSESESSGSRTDSRLRRRAPSTSTITWTLSTSPTLPLPQSPPLAPPPMLLPSAQFFPGPSSRMSPPTASSSPMSRSPGMHTLNTFTRLAFLSSPDAREPIHLAPPPHKTPSRSGATTPTSPYAAAADECSSPELPDSPDAWDSDSDDEMAMDWSPCARRGTVTAGAGFLVPLPSVERVSKAPTEWAGARWGAGRLEGLGLSV